MTPGEWSLCLLGIQLAVPLLNAQYCIMNNFGGGFNVLENILQRHVLTGAPRLQGLAAKWKEVHTTHRRGLLCLCNRHYVYVLVCVCIPVCARAQLMELEYL